MTAYTYLHCLANYISLYYIWLGTQPKESFIMPLSTGLGGVVIVFVITVAISVAILIKSRKNILSQKVDTQHYTKPPAGSIKQNAYI